MRQSAAKAQSENDHVDRAMWVPQQREYKADSGVRVLKDTERW